MTFCVCAMSLSTVSCGKLEDDLNTLKGQVENLTLKLAELESKLNTEVANLNAAIAAVDAKVAVVKVEEKDGMVVLTLANGNTLNVGKADANANNSGLVTTVTNDGKTYWAVVKEDGTVESLNVEVGHPTLSFKVDAETKNLLISYDGKTYESTGVVVRDPEAYSHVITGFAEGEDYVAFTIGGKEYKLPKYDGNAVLGLSRANFFLRYEGEKQVELTAEGIEEFYVMAKPNGWKASFEKNILTVTAPTKAAIEIGAAEKVGEVLVHATTNDGKCKIAKIDVKAGPGLTLDVDVAGNITVENSYYGEFTSNWGDVSFGFSDFVFGLATPADFNADPVKYLETYNTTYMAPNYSDIIFPSLYNIAQGGEYVEGEYETDIVKTTVSEAYFMWMYEELPAGSHFVVWAAPVDGEGKAVIGDVVYTEYLHLTHKVEVASVSHSDATLKIKVEGASSYIINAVAESYYNREDNPTTFEDFMQAPMGGPWAGFKKYGAVNALGMEIPAESMPEEIKLSELLGEKLMFNENYKVWVMPVPEHMKKLDEANSWPEENYYVYDFSAFDFNKNFMPYVIDLKTNDIVEGGAYEAELLFYANTFTSIEATINAAEGTESIYYAWYKASEYVDFASEAAIRASLVENCFAPLTEGRRVSKTYINPGDKYVLATFTIGTDGKYGKVVAKTFEATPIPYNKDITVEVVSCTLSEDGKNYIVTVNVTGADKVIGYNITDNEAAKATYLKNVCMNGHKSAYSNYQMANVTDGQAVLTFEKNNYKKNYYVAAYTVANNAVNAISKDIAVIDLGL